MASREISTQSSEVVEQHAKQAKFNQNVEQRIV